MRATLGLLLSLISTCALPAPPAPRANNASTAARIEKLKHEQLVHLHERKREQFLRRHNVSTVVDVAAAAEAAEAEAEDGPPPAPRSPAPPAPPPRPATASPMWDRETKLEWRLSSAPKAFLAVLGLAGTYWVARCIYGDSEQGLADAKVTELKRFHHGFEPSANMLPAPVAARPLPAAPPPEAVAKAKAAARVERRTAAIAAASPARHVWDGGRLVVAPSGSPDAQEPAADEGEGDDEGDDDEGDDDEAGAVSEDSWIPVDAVPPGGA